MDKASPKPFWTKEQMMRWPAANQITPKVTASHTTRRRDKSNENLQRSCKRHNAWRVGIHAAGVSRQP